MDARVEIESETRRIVHRLETMPLSRFSAEVSERVRACASIIVEATDDSDRPDEAQVPLLGPTGLAPQVAVVVHDYLAQGFDRERDDEGDRDSQVLAELVALRRFLP